MLKELLGQAAKSILDPINELDARLERAFNEFNFVKFKLTLDLILENTSSEELPYATFERIVYKAATLGKDEYCSLLLPHTSGRSYLEGNLNYYSMVGNVAEMKRLVEQGVNVHNGRDQPLRTAVMARQQQSVDYLCAAGCRLAVAMDATTLENIRALPQGKIIDDFLDIQKKRAEQTSSGPQSNPA